MGSKTGSQSDASNSPDAVENVDEQVEEQAGEQAGEPIESGIADRDLVDSLGVAREETQTQADDETVAGDAKDDAAAGKQAGAADAGASAAAGAGSGAGAGAGTAKPDPVEQKLAKLEDQLGKLLEKSSAGEELTTKEKKQAEQALRNIDKLREARKGGSFDILEEASAQLLLDSLDEQARENAELRERLSKLESDTEPVREDAVWTRASREHGLPAEKLQTMFNEEVKRVAEEEGFQGSELRAAATYAWKQRIKAEKAAPKPNPQQQQQTPNAGAGGRQQTQQQPRGSTSISPRTPRRPAAPAVDEEAEFLKQYGKDLVDTHTERGT